MKKSTIIELVQSHYEKNESLFNKALDSLIEEFVASGEIAIAEHLRAVSGKTITFSIPETISEDNLSGSLEFPEFFYEMPYSSEPLFLPEPIAKDIKNIIGGISRNQGANRIFLFGPKGSGKTETVKNIARILGRRLIGINLSKVYEFPTSQIEKNFSILKEAMNSYLQTSQVIFCCDDIHCFAKCRINDGDETKREEEARAFLQFLDSLRRGVVLLAETDSAEHLEPNFLSHFDCKVDFGRYSTEDIMEAGSKLYTELGKREGASVLYPELIGKLISTCSRKLTMAELKGIFQTSFLFSETKEPEAHLRRIFGSLYGSCMSNEDLFTLGFAPEEIELLTARIKNKSVKEPL